MSDDNRNAVLSLKELEYTRNNGLLDIANSTNTTIGMEGSGNTSKLRSRHVNKLSVGNMLVIKGIEVGDFSQVAGCQETKEFFLIFDVNQDCRNVTSRKCDIKDTFTVDDNGSEGSAVFGVCRFLSTVEV